MNWLTVSSATLYLFKALKPRYRMPHNLASQILIRKCRFLGRVYREACVQVRSSIQANEYSYILTIGRTDLSVRNGALIVFWVESLFKYWLSLLRVYLRIQHNWWKDSAISVLSTKIKLEINNNCFRSYFDILDEFGWTAVDRRLSISNSTIWESYKTRHSWRWYINIGTRRNTRATPNTRRYKLYFIKGRSAAESNWTTVHKI